MWTYNHIDELYHHGIKGMRWGVRRFQKKDGSLTPAGRKRYDKNDSHVERHEDYKRAHTAKSVKSMSDAELQARLKRLQMEKQYSDINPMTVNKGKQALDTIIKVGVLVSSVTGTAITIANNIDKISKMVKQ